MNQFQAGIDGRRIVPNRNLQFPGDGSVQRLGWTDYRFQKGTHALLVHFNKTYPSVTAITDKRSGICQYNRVKWFSPKRILRSFDNLPVKLAGS